jgi:hypothetical protein
MKKKIITKERTGQLTNSTVPHLVMGVPKSLLLPLPHLPPPPPRPLNIFAHMRM